MRKRAIYFLLLGLSSLALGTTLPQEKAKLTARDLFIAGSKSDHPIGSQTPSPLGLRYSILKQISDNSIDVIEVSTDTIFRSGERIRLSVEANNRGYLYIISRGTSGWWTLLFPSKEILDGKNVLEKAKRYEIPLGDIWFTFDKNPGVEKLFIVLSRQPEPNLEKLIYSLRQNQEATPTQQSADKGKGGSVQVFYLDDAEVNKIRAEVSTRDLVFEKVNEEKSSGTKADKAVYVVNQTGSADSKVVADVSLNHH